MEKATCAVVSQQYRHKYWLCELMEAVFDCASADAQVVTVSISEHANNAAAWEWFSCRSLSQLCAARRTASFATLCLLDANAVPPSSCPAHANMDVFSVYMFPALASLLNRDSVEPTLQRVPSQAGVFAENCWCLAAHRSWPPVLKLCSWLRLYSGHHRKTCQRVPIPRACWQLCRPSSMML